MTINPVLRQRQRKLLVIGHQINGWQQIIAAAAGKEDSQTQQAAQMLGMKPYPVQKAAASAKKKSYAQLVKMLDAFAAIEWNQKQGLAKAEDSLMLTCQENF